MLAQFILSITLLFGFLTIVPRGILLIRLGRMRKGMIYLAMALVFAFFTALSISLALDSLKAWRALN